MGELLSTSLYGTINPSAQSSRIKQTAGRSVYNLGSSMDIDIDRMMEKNLIQIKRTISNSLVVSTALLQQERNEWRAGEDAAAVLQLNQQTPGEQILEMRWEYFCKVFLQRKAQLACIPATD
ncbi:MAG: hypothetical protein EZS28_017464 [Streblomastix strix]|uniref:Uncharacterized protein n=1 Tax=Streblomastix strix TaxID=222440 RepID=A0A5J4VXU3_9EUKA|nr:MAG: hypothetical protein EZS28_017464 [Streblomastix strix]